MDFDNFADWMMGQGWVQGLTIDRIDNDGHYCPGNCQLLTFAENSAKAPKTTERKAAACRRNAAIAHRANDKPVRCIETGVVFQSMRVAALEMGVNATSILRAMYRNGTSKGYHWEYVAK